MKNIFLIFSLVTICCFTSCQDLTDSLDTNIDSSLDPDYVFTVADLTRNAIDGIKIPLGETNSYRGRYTPYYGFNTDVEWYNSLKTGEEKSQLCMYDATKTNPQMNTTNNVWAMMYSGIERANICIKGIRKVGNPKVGNEMGMLLGQALTLRAIYYADLLKTWGDVPARFEPVTEATLYISKSDRDIIYKQIIADLGEAAELTPWPNATAYTSSVERINKAFVKGLRAKLALAASGYQQYPDGVRRSKDADLSVEKMYALALKECREVINSGTCKLESSFETLWKKYNQENITAGGESLWEIPFADGRGRVAYSFAVRHTSIDQYQGQGKGGSAGPLPTVFYDYDQADTRRDVTCVPYKYGVADANNKAKQELGSSDVWYFGKYRYEWMTRFVTSDQDDGLNKIYMRYAEVVLMAAETANELEGPAAAAPYLKLLRNRAFPVASQPIKVDAYVSGLTTKGAMFNAIVDENKFEFTGEMERKQALIRWNLLKDKLDEAKAKMTNWAARTGEYADVPKTLYFKYNADNVSLSIYGLNRGEIANPGSTYTSFSWEKLEPAKIDLLYNSAVNPNDKQFWPIWQVFIDASNGMLVNDYGY
jgi:hypothetical protein